MPDVKEPVAALKREGLTALSEGEVGGVSLVYFDAVLGDASIIEILGFDEIAAAAAMAGMKAAGYAARGPQDAVLSVSQPSEKD